MWGGNRRLAEQRRRPAASVVGVAAVLVVLAAACASGSTRPTASGATGAEADREAASSSEGAVSSEGGETSAESAPGASPTADPSDQPTATPTPTPTPDDRPNVIVFLTDDQTVESMRVMTATTRLLGDEGMSFAQSFVNVPVCCPSRATLLTGQRAANHGVLWNNGTKGGFANFDDQDRTLVTALQESGYDTRFVGKYLNGYGFFPANQVHPPGWSDFAGLISPSDGLYRDNSFFVNGRVVDIGPDRYVTDEITEFVIDDLDEVATGDAPFFLLVGYTAPHGEAGLPLDELDYRTFPQDIIDRYPDEFLVRPIPAERHAGAFADETLPETPAFNEADVDDKPGFLRRFPQDEERIAKLTDFYRAELESLLAVDESVAAIVARLAELGELDDTYLIFTSDNGFLHGEHRILTGKYYPYEEATRVPLVVRGPGVAAGVSSNMMVSNVDLAPTILDIAATTPHREPDGLSLLPLLLGDEPETGRAIVIEGYAFRPLAPPYIAVHTGDSLYVEWAPGERELYDLVADPYQLENLAGRADHADLEARNAALLDQLRDCSGVDCHLLDVGLAVPTRP